MAALNRGAAEAVRALGIRAVTDVSGFGLLGHLRQMLRASGVSARVENASVPLLLGALELASTSRFPGGSLRNLADVRRDVRFPRGMPRERRLLLADAQTSGGLLVAVRPELVPDLLLSLEESAPVFAEIGEIEDGPPGRIDVK
jgi:selenide,water dikinase